MKSLVTALATLIFTIAAHAQLSQIGAITAGGSGCVNSNIRVSVGTAAINVAYPEFNVQPDDKSALARVTCSLAIPVSVPEGFQLVASAASSGLSRLQGADRANLSQELFLAGSRGVPQAANLTSSNRLFTLGKLNAAATLVKSACGHDAILRLNVSATVRKTAVTSQSKLAINKSTVAFKLVPCK